MRRRQQASTEDVSYAPTAYAVPFTKDQVSQGENYPKEEYAPREKYYTSAETAARYPEVERVEKEKAEFYNLANQLISDGGYSSGQAHQLAQEMINTRKKAKQVEFGGQLLSVRQAQKELDDKNDQITAQTRAQEALADLSRINEKNLQMFPQDLESFRKKHFKILSDPQFGRQVQSAIMQKQADNKNQWDIAGDYLTGHGGHKGQVLESLDPYTGEFDVDSGYSNAAMHREQKAAEDAESYGRKRKIVSDMRIEEFNKRQDFLAKQHAMSAQDAEAEAARVGAVKDRLVGGKWTYKMPDSLFSQPAATQPATDAQPAAPATTSAASQDEPAVEEEQPKALTAKVLTDMKNKYNIPNTPEGKQKLMDLAKQEGYTW